jgi:hypothetical protein
MNKLQARMLRMDFRRIAKQFVIIAVTFFLVSAVVIGLSCRTQIGEAINLHRQGVELTDDKDRASFDNKEYHHDRENDRTKENILSENEGQSKNAVTQDSNPITPLPTATKIVLVVILAIGGLLGIAYWVLIAMWLYQASVSVSMNGVVWLILGIFFNLCAVIAFFIIRSTRAACPVCGKRQDKSGYCRFCGSKMQVLCSECGATIQNLDAYCHNCGASLRNSEEK